MVVLLQLSPASLLLWSPFVPFISRRRRNKTGFQFLALAVPIFMELGILSGGASPAFSCFSSSVVSLCTFHFKKKKKQNWISIFGPGGSYLYGTWNTELWCFSSFLLLLFFCGLPLYLSFQEEETKLQLNCLGAWWFLLLENLEY